ncbi:MAG TPA: flagellar hook-associated protein FlgK [Bacillota bacterium]|nr:flagellar hook-associated protein FlgK [Bacillota bacterium]
MRSTFAGIETAYRALQANQLALDITGHNIANANTEGYSRQVATFSATAPYTNPAFNRSATAGQIGTGVEVAYITRMRDMFVDLQIRQENHALGRWTARYENLHQLELIYNEPSETGIADALDQFWTALQDLANRAENTSVRAVVQQRAIILTDSIRSVYEQVAQLQRDLNQEITTRVSEINALANQIADLNEQIGKVTSLGDQANDLMDQRELLVEKLSKLTNIEVTTDNVGRYNITISGKGLVYGEKVTELYLDPDLDRQGLVDVKWTDSKEKVQFKDGSVKGLLEVRDEDIEIYQKMINDMASSLINEMNAIHSAGYGLDGSTGIAFFSGSDASNIRVNNEILVDGRRIAAAIGDEPGEGQNALKMAALLKTPIMNAGTTTYAAYYSSIISRLGVDAQKATTMKDNQEVLVGHLKDRQESVAGVSLDEEMANMIKFQHAYNAAARILTTLDAVLDTIINKMAV